MSDRYALAPGLVLDVDGPGWARRHVSREYGPGSQDEHVPAAVRLHLGSGPGPRTGSYRSLRWTVELSDPLLEAIDLRVDLRSRPRWFGLSLLQGWYVEPVLSVVAAELGTVLLPAAAFERSDQVLLLLGRSGAGKTSLAVRALAAGQPVMGDDQVLLDGTGCRRFRRRLRVYADLRQTAPAAHRRLTSRRRAGLAVREVLRSVTRGVIHPPQHLDAREIGPVSTGPLPVHRVVLVDRGDVPDLVREAATPADAVVEALVLLDHQRARLPHAWQVRVAAARRAEERILTGALEGVPVERLVVPRSWSAPQAIRRLEEELAEA